MTLGSFLTGQSVQTSVKTGMSLAQIGEFSFIIAGVGVAMCERSGPADLPVAVFDRRRGLRHHDAAHALADSCGRTDRGVRRSQAAALAADVRRALRHLAGKAAGQSPGDEQTNRVRQLVRWLVVDAVVVAAIIIGASLELDTISELGAAAVSALAAIWSTAFVVAATVLVSAPFWIGMVRVSRVLGFELARAACFPMPSCEQTDLAAAPRRLLVVTLQLAIVLLVGIPLVAITQPFVPTLRGAAVLVVLLALLAIAFWRNATNLQGHTRAAAQAIVQAIGRQTRKGRAMEADAASKRSRSSTK